MTRKPEWLRVPYYYNQNIKITAGLLDELKLNTVCTEAACPNRSECFSKKTATFMILGTKCTRNCRFCNISFGMPQPVDEDEPVRIAAAIKKLHLRYVVVTSVTRDDLRDGGAAHFLKTVRAIRDAAPEAAIEVLIPDLKDLRPIIDASPEVISHNIETVETLYATVRPEANYNRSLTVLRSIKQLNPKIRSKSGMMLGMGEPREEVLKTLDDLLEAGCELLTMGQYLSPGKKHYPVKEYIEPHVFAGYAETAKKMGFRHVEAAPLVRSSYNAAKAFYNK